MELQRRAAKGIANLGCKKELEKGVGKRSWKKELETEIAETSCQIQSRKATTRLGPTTSRKCRKELILRLLRRTVFGQHAWGFVFFAVFKKDVFSSCLRSPSAVNINQIQPSVL